jgi:hypothetical protein
LLAVALPDLKGALGGSYSDSRFAHNSAVLSVDSQQRQRRETEEARAFGTKAAIKRPISNLACQHPVPSGFIRSRTNMRKLKARHLVLAV